MVELPSFSDCAPSCCDQARCGAKSWKLQSWPNESSSEFRIPKMYTPHWKAQHHMSMCRQDTLLPDSTRWSPPARSSGSGRMGGIPTQRLRSHLWKRSSREYQWGQHCTSAAGGPRPASRPGHADGRLDAFHVVQAAAWKLDAVLRTLSLRIARISGASCYWPEDMTSCKPCWLACCLAYFEAGLFLTDGAWCMISHVALFIDGQWEFNAMGTFLNLWIWNDDRLPIYSGKILRSQTSAIRQAIWEWFPHCRSFDWGRGKVGTKLIQIFSCLIKQISISIHIH